MRSDMPGLLKLCVTFTKNMSYILYIGVSMDICIGIGSELSKVGWYISKSLIRKYTLLYIYLLQVLSVSN